MTLLFIDGFDAQDAAGKWMVYMSTGSSGGSVGYTSSTRLGAGYGVQLAASTLGTVYTMAKAVTPSSHLYVGAAIKISVLGTGTSVPFHVLRADSGATGHLYLVVTTSGVVQLWRGDGLNLPRDVTGYIPQGTLLASSPVGALDTHWHFVELGATIDSSAGVAVVKVDGVTVISFTGNTRNGGTSTQFDTLAYSAMEASNFGTPIPLGAPIVDDLYVCNSSGSVNNTFLGDARVQTLQTTGAGTYTQLTPTGSGSNYLNVSEVPDNQATYNASATTGQRDTYAMADLAAGTGTVYALQQVMSASKSAAGTANLKQAQLLGGTLYYAPAHSLGTSWTTYCDLAETNPATSAAWTLSDVNGMESGAEVA